MKEQGDRDEMVSRGCCQCWSVGGRPDVACSLLAGHVFFSSAFHPNSISFLPPLFYLFFLSSAMFHLGHFFCLFLPLQPEELEFADMIILNGFLQLYFPVSYNLNILYIEYGLSFASSFAVLLSMISSHLPVS